MKIALDVKAATHYRNICSIIYWEFYVLHFLNDYVISNEINDYEFECGKGVCKLGKLHFVINSPGKRSWKLKTL